MNQLEDVRAIELESYPEDDATVVVATSARQVPFAVARLFTITASAGAVRGRHAHRRCAQFMVCVHGVMNIVCTDGQAERAFLLDRGNLALLVPPTIWNTVNVRTEGAVLTVLCDRVYEEHDYIRDYMEFIAFRQAQ
jgi:dTDP-4-dehydrorhamnose 3,5-epimerase-like enzyme